MSDTKAAKPVSDAGLVDSIYALRGMDAGHALTIEERREAADTLERLAKIEQRAKQAARPFNDLRGSDPGPEIAHGIRLASWILGEGDQLQGGSDK